MKDSGNLLSILDFPCYIKRFKLNAIKMNYLNIRNQKDVDCYPLYRGNFKIFLLNFRFLCNLHCFDPPFSEKQYYNTLTFKTYTQCTLLHEYNDFLYLETNFQPILSQSESCGCNISCKNEPCNTLVPTKESS